MMLHKAKIFSKVQMVWIWNFTFSLTGYLTKLKKLAYFSLFTYNTREKTKVYIFCRYDSTEKVLCQEFEHGA